MVPKQRECQGTLPVTMDESHLTAEEILGKF